MSINELRLAIADAEDDLNDLMRDQTTSRQVIDEARRQIYFMRMELQYKMAGSSMKAYCEQNPWEPECKIYDV